MNTNYDKAKGEEIRKKYGEDSLISANEKTKKMYEKRFDLADTIFEEIKALLKVETPKNDFTTDGAKKIFDLHKKYLACYYKDFSKEYHLAMATIYVEDKRFVELYENICKGASSYMSNLIKYNYECV